MKKRVLIGYAECGSGHKSASEYIKKYFDEFNKYEVMVYLIINLQVKGIINYVLSLLIVRN